MHQFECYKLVTTKRVIASGKLYIFLKNLSGNEDYSRIGPNCTDKCGAAMSFPQGPSAFGGGSGGQGQMQQRILPEIPKEALWFILNLKTREKI